MARRQLRAVFFDIDDTLYSTQAFAHKARTNAVRALHDHGVRLPVEHLYDELLEVVSEFSSNHESHFNKLLLRLSRRAYEGINPAILVAAAVAAYHDTKREGLKPFPDALELLRALARTDLVRGIITSGLEVKQAEKLVRLGVVPLLTSTAIFISDQIGISKPNPKLWRRACEEAGVAPKESMFVGDDPVKDTDPAHEVGLATVLVRRPGARHRARGRHAPDFTVTNFKELHAILQKEFKAT